MPKKRLENALNAGKLIQLGFNLNKSKPESLNLLYTVNCVKKTVNYNNQEIKDKKSYEVDSGSESDTDSSLSKLEKSDDYEKIEILSLQFHENQNILATGDSNGDIQIYDVFSGQTIQSNDSETTNKKSNFDKYFQTNTRLSNSNVYNMPIICMKWHPYSDYSLNFLFYAHVNGYIGVFDKDNFRKSLLIEEKDEISCIDFNLDGSVIASVGKDYTIKLYDSNLNNPNSINKLLKTYGANNIDNKTTFLSNISSALSSILSNSSQSASHTNRLQSVKFSNTSNDIFFSGGWDRTVKVWDKRTANGYVNTLQGPFVCGSDAIDVNDNLVLTASWVKENALDLWDIRKFKKVCNLPIAQNDKKLDDPEVDTTSLSYKLKLKDKTVNEYLYACKFFSSSNHVFNENDKSRSKNYSTVLACGSGTQSLHLIDYEQPIGKHLLSSLDCQSPLYCLDAIYSCSLIACGGMKNFYTMMGTSK